MIRVSLADALAFGDGELITPVPFDTVDLLVGDGLRLRSPGVIGISGPGLYLAQGQLRFNSTGDVAVTATLQISSNSVGELSTITSEGVPNGSSPFCALQALRLPDETPFDATDFAVAAMQWTAAGATGTISGAAFGGASLLIWKLADVENNPAP